MSRFDVFSSHFHSSYLAAGLLTASVYTKIFEEAFLSLRVSNDLLMKG